MSCGWTFVYSFGCIVIVVISLACLVSHVVKDESEDPYE